MPFGAVDFDAIATGSAGRRVLDLGCGDGSLLRYLKERAQPPVMESTSPTQILASVRKTG
jgi:cyclopropane fatty-acyl-phospholipid synthase-like methyltransferase